MELSHLSHADNSNGDSRNSPINYLTNPCFEPLTKSRNTFCFIVVTNLYRDLLNSMTNGVVLKIKYLIDGQVICSGEKTMPSESMAFTGT